jgi:hypothetical protein
MEQQPDPFRDARKTSPSVNEQNFQYKETPNLHPISKSKIHKTEDLHNRTNNNHSITG